MAVDRRSVEMLLFAFLARYMIRPLCKQVWGMTAYLDLSSTGGPRLSSYWEVSCRPSSNTFRLAPSHVLSLIFSISHQILSTSHLARLPVIAFPMTGYFDWNQDYDSGGVAHAIRFMLLILWQMRMIPKNYNKSWFSRAAQAGPESKTTAGEQEMPQGEIQRLLHWTGRLQVNPPPHHHDHDHVFFSSPSWSCSSSFSSSSPGPWSPTRCRTASEAAEMQILVLQSRQSPGQHQSEIVM